MDNSFVIPVAVVGVAVIVFSAVFGVAHLSGDNIPAPENLAPLQTAPRYAVGDIVQSHDSLSFVVVTGFDDTEGMYSYQDATVNINTGKMRIREGTGKMSCEEFERLYPYLVKL